MIDYVASSIFPAPDSCLQRDYCQPCDDATRSIVIIRTCIEARGTGFDLAIQSELEGYH